MCSGSLGDPVVNITFGSGGGSTGYTPTSGYTYTSSTCPNDGFYTITNSTSNCFGNSWHTVLNDHTGDGGAFMLVNASVNPGDFFLTTVTDLCPNTTYEFAAWIMNVILPSACGGNTIQPNLTFSIEKTDGTILQTYNTGSIPPLSSPTWKQYGVFFTTPAGVPDIVLRIFNNSQGGCGNDLALDDITFRPCGPQINNFIDGLSATPISYCYGPAKQFQLSCTLSGGFTNPVFKWQARTPGNSNWFDVFAANSNSLSYGIAANGLSGVYEARLAVSEAANLNILRCTVYSTPFTITVNANPVTTALSNSPVCEKDTLVLTATGGIQYDWTGTNGFTGTGSPLSLVNVQPSHAGNYYVVVTNSEGCVHIDSTTVIVNPMPVANTSFSNTSICFKDSVQLAAAGGSTYEWIPATGLSTANVFNPEASPGATTIYQVAVGNQFSCTDTASVTVNVIRPPRADAGPDKAILDGQSVQLSGSINGTGNSFSWSPSININDIHDLQPMVSPSANVNYILNVVSDFGCGTSSDTVLVKVYKNIFIPSAFSPNGDGRNDTWNIPALAVYPLFEVAVYNRWGQLVFHTKNTLKPWDGTFNGKPLPIGSYNYFIDVGKSQYIFRGSVLIIH